MHPYPKAGLSNYDDLAKVIIVSSSPKNRATKNNTQL